MTSNKNGRKSIDNRTARERIRSGQLVIEIEGPPDYVERRMEEHLSRLGQRPMIPGKVKRISPDQPELPGFGDDNTPMLVESNGVSPETNNTSLNGRNGHHEPQDLVSFYLKLAPKSQPDQILVITYFYQKYRGCEHLTLDNYQEAYDTLKRLKVDPPTNMNSSVRNVVNRSDYLYSPVSGRFALTIQGEQHIDAMAAN